MPSGRQWTVANLEGYSEDGEEVVITNVSDGPARVELFFNASYSYSDNVVTTVDVPARRRLVYPLRSGVDRLPWVAGTLRVTSQPTDRGTAEIVVEALTYQTIDGDPQSQQLDRMKNEFLAAQQRRRNQAPVTTRPDDTHDGPRTADPDGGGMAIAAAVRPLPPRPV